MYKLNAQFSEMRSATWVVTCKLYKNILHLFHLFSVLLPIDFSLRLPIYHFLSLSVLDIYLIKRLMLAILTSHSFLKDTFTISIPHRSHFAHHHKVLERTELFLQCSNLRGQLKWGSKQSSRNWGEECLGRMNIITW